MQEHNNTENYSLPLVNTQEGYSKCMEIIQLILDGEAKEDDLKFFKSNIECCQKSMEHYKFEQEVRSNIKSKLGEICPPENLEDCIREKINAMCKCNEGK